MIEPVALADFFVGFFSAALIIVIAAVYAVLYTWSQLSGRKGLRRFSWLVYGALLACVAVFAKVFHLNDFWRVLVLLMAAGYWAMPRLIWRLCVATHGDEKNH